MWQNEQQELGILDVISILSFGLQLQNRESHQIEQLRSELANELQKRIEAQLDRIESKLDRIITNFEL